MFKYTLLLVAAAALPQQLPAHPPRELEPDARLAPPKDNKVPAELVGEWLLQPTTGLDLPAKSEFVARIAADGSFSTRVINQCGGTINSTAKNALSFGPMFSTQMAGPPELMQIEATVLQRLAEVRSYKLEARTLELCDQEGKVLLKYLRKGAKADGKNPPPARTIPADPDTPVSSSPQG